MFNYAYLLSVHWTQRVIDNYEGVEQDQLDIDDGQTDPYYDNGGDAGSSYFIDYPWVPNRYLALKYAPGLKIQPNENTNSESMAKAVSIAALLSRFRLGKSPQVKC